MKKSIILSFVFMATTMMVNAQAKMEAWTELKNFHHVMSQTYHPSEEGNLQPIKKRAGEMKEKAALLASSKIPADFDNEKVKSAINRLKEGTEKLEKMIADTATDKEITDYLAGLHDIFHEIVELCSKKDHPHNE